MLKLQRLLIREINISSQYVSLLTESIGLAIVEYILEGGKPKSILKQMEKDYTNLAKELEYR